MSLVFVVEAVTLAIIGAVANAVVQTERMLGDIDGDRNVGQLLGKHVDRQFGNVFHNVNRPFARANTWDLVGYHCKHCLRKM